MVSGYSNPTLWHTPRECSEEQLESRIGQAIDGVTEFGTAHQPLLSMYGHIHESPGDVRIRRTTCLNPGSEYQGGVLRAYVVDIEDDKIKQCLRVEN